MLLSIRKSQAIFEDFSQISMSKTFGKSKLQDNMNKRVREDSDSGTEVDIFKSPSKKLKPTFIVQDKEINAFFRLFGEYKRKVTFFRDFI